MGQNEIKITAFGREISGPLLVDPPVEPGAVSGIRLEEQFAKEFTWSIFIRKKYKSYINISWQMMKVTPTDVMMKQGSDAVLLL
jgi:hypothetical protein